MCVFVSRAEDASPSPGEDSQMSVDSILRVQARSLIQAGKVPNRLPTRVWGGLGVGTPCIVCGMPVKDTEPELKIEFTFDQGATTTSHHLHAVCFTALE